MMDLSRVERDAAREVEESMMTFSEISDLPKEALRRLVSSFHLDVWAAALHNAPSGLAEKIAEHIPGGLRAGFLDSLRGPQPPDKTMEAKSKIMMAAIRMKSEGLLDVSGEQ